MSSFGLKMEMKAGNFVSKPNNNQEKTKTNPKLLNGDSPHAAAALFKSALALAPYRSVCLPGAPRLLSVFYDSTLLHSYTFYTFYVLH